LGRFYTQLKKAFYIKGFQLVNIASLIPKLQKGINTPAEA